jgi:CHASE1-domain containing sensor protein
MNGRRLLGAGLMVGALVTVGLSAHVSVEQRELSECLAGYSVATAEAIKARAAANEEFVDATDAVWNAVLTAKSRDEARRTFTAYIAARNKARALRAAHPLPDPPTISECGDAAAGL